MSTRRRFSWLNAGIWVALVLALVGSLRHVAWSFATMEAGDLLAGYVQAVAVDAGLAFLALGIQQRRKQRRPVAVLWAGVGVFSLISIYANYLFGVVHLASIDAPLASLRPVVLAAVLPLLVLYLSEVAGEDVQALSLAAKSHDAPQSEPAQRNESAPSVHTEIGMRDGNGHRAHNCPYCGASFESGQQVAAHVRWRCESRPASVAEVQS